MQPLVATGLACVGVVALGGALLGVVGVARLWALRSGRSAPGDGAGGRPAASGVTRVSSTPSAAHADPSGAGVGMVVSPSKVPAFEPPLVRQEAPEPASTPPVDIDEAKLEAAIHLLLSTRGPIDAIRHVRAVTGLGLREAKQRVDRVADARAAIEGPPDVVPGPALYAELRARMAQGRRVDAVRLGRQATGLSLAEVNDICLGLLENTDGPPHAGGAEPAGSVGAILVGVLRFAGREAAIARARELTGFSQSDAESLIDALEVDPRPSTDSSA